MSLAEFEHNTDAFKAEIQKQYIKYRRPGWKDPLILGMWMDYLKDAFANIFTPSDKAELLAVAEKILSDLETSITGYTYFEEQTALYEAKGKNVSDTPIPNACELRMYLYNFCRLIVDDEASVAEAYKAGREDYACTSLADLFMESPL